MVFIGKSREQRRGVYLYWKKEEVGGVVLTKSPLEESKCSMMTPYWLSC